MAQTFYIFRHGETFASRDEIPYGDKQLTAEILPEAIPVLERLGEYLAQFKSDMRISSEFLRCRQTVEIVSSKINAEFEFDQRLNEYYKESLDDYRVRIKGFVDEITQKNVENIFICTHGAGIAAIKNFLVKGEFLDEDLPDYPKTGILTIIKDKNFEEISFR